MSSEKKDSGPSLVGSDNQGPPGLSPSLPLSPTALQLAGEFNVLNIGLGFADDPQHPQNDPQLGNIGAIPDPEKQQGKQDTDKDLDKTQNILGKASGEASSRTFSWSFDANFRNWGWSPFWKGKFDPEGTDPAFDQNPVTRAIDPRGPGPASDDGFDARTVGEPGGLGGARPDLAAPHFGTVAGGAFGGEGTDINSQRNQQLGLHDPRPPAGLDPWAGGATTGGGAPMGDQPHGVSRWIRDPRGPGIYPNPDGGGPGGPAARNTEDSAVPSLVGGFSHLFFRG